MIKERRWEGRVGEGRGGEERRGKGENWNVKGYNDLVQL